MRTELITSTTMRGLKTESPLRHSPQQKTSFVEEFKKTLEKVDSSQKEADSAAMQAANGGAEQIHETMVKMEEAGINMRLLLKVRSKALDAYQEVMRMQF
ncbi:MAG TPA: flagellar hook-basal body complex protein FliE [Syntrophobacteraceae bacterium]|jgi:flagellar hook-basal body complex protein FliE|nr:flagellar hook-basal body complex protein FliE [Syntrophobacteraceae bacterium]